MTAEAPLTGQDLARLVDRFYEAVRRDAVLGPVFAPVVDDWDAHKSTLVEFWTSVVLRSGRYRGNPMAMHRRLPIQARHFDRWLELWERTARETLGDAHARTMTGHARRIGASLRYGLGLEPGRTPPLLRGDTHANPPD